MQCSVFAPTSACNKLPGCTSEALFKKFTSYVTSYQWHGNNNMRKQNLSRDMVNKINELEIITMLG
jgi:hypothetical protein